MEKKPGGQRCKNRHMRSEHTKRTAKISDRVFLAKDAKPEDIQAGILGTGKCELSHKANQLVEARRAGEHCGGKIEACTK